MNTTRVELEGRTWSIEYDDLCVVFPVNGHRFREERRMGETIEQAGKRLITQYLHGQYSADEQIRRFRHQVGEALALIKEGLQMLEESFERAGGPAPITLKQKILEAMKKYPGPKTPAQIRTLLRHHSYNIVQTAMAELVIQKRLQRISRGRYDLRT